MGIPMDLFYFIFRPNGIYVLENQDVLISQTDNLIFIYFSCFIFFFTEIIISRCTADDTG